MAEFSGGGTGSPSSETSTPQDPSVLLTVCCSCSVQLLIPSQKRCHECGAPQHAQTSMEHSGEQKLTAPLTQPSSLDSQPSHPPQPVHHDQPSVQASDQRMQQPAPPAVVKRFVKGDTSDLPCKRSRTEEKDITTTPQNLAELSGAVVRSQIPQHQLTSPLVADSAHGTPHQPHTGSVLDATANKHTIETAKHLSDPPLHVSPQSVPSPDYSSSTHSNTLLLGPTCSAGTLPSLGETPQSHRTTADESSQRAHDLNEFEQARKRKLPQVPHGSGGVGSSRSLPSKKLCRSDSADEKVDEVHQEEGLKLVAHQPPPVQVEGTSSTPSPHSLEESPKQQSSSDDVSSPNPSTPDEPKFLTPPSSPQLQQNDVPTTSTTVDEDDTKIKVGANKATTKGDSGSKQDEKNTDSVSKGRTESIPEKGKVNNEKNIPKCTKKNEELKQLESHEETQKKPAASGDVHDQKGNQDASQPQSGKVDTNSEQVIEGDNATEPSSKEMKNGKACADHTSAKPKDDTTQRNAKGGSNQASSNSQGKSKKKNEKKKTESGASHKTPFTGPPPPALNPPIDKAVTVHFNAILPKSAWAWDDNTSAVYIRFMDHELGHKSYDLGPGKIKRDVGNGLFVVKIKAKMSVDYLKRNPTILYKYVVFSHQVEVENPYEYLYGAPHGSGLTNRALKVPYSKRSSKEVIKQFDTMIFPEVKDKSTIVKRTVNFLWDLIGVGSESDHPKFTVPPPDDMRSTCMKIHLEPYKNGMLSGEFEGGFDVYRSVEDFTALYQCCLTQYCGKETYAVNEWGIKRIQNDIREWLQEIVAQLADISTLNSSAKLAAAVVLMCCAHRVCISGVSDNTCFTLVKMMALLPDGEGIIFLRSLMKNEAMSRPLVIKSLIDTMNQIIRQRKREFTVHLLKALPLLHFLRGDCSPRGQCVVQPVWLDPDIHLGTVRYEMLYEKDFMNKHYQYQELQSLFALDPLLVFAVAYICPRCDIADLCDNIHLPYAIALVNKNTSDSDALKGEWETGLQEIIINPLSAIQKRVLEADTLELSVFDHCLEGASLLLKTLSKKEIKASNLHLKVMRSSIALVLSLMSRIDSVSKGSQEVDQGVTLMKKAAVELHDFLNTWVKRVIGSVLGGISYWGKPLPVSTRLERETKVWLDLLELECPPSVKQDWHEVVETIVTERVKHLPPEERIDMLCELEDGSNTSSSCTLITNIFITESIAALEELIFTKPHHNTRSIERIMSSKSARVINALGSILKKKYPREEEIPLMSLLEWDLWPGFINIHASQVVTPAKDRPSSDWQRICLCALNTLGNTCTRIINGDISMSELQIIQDRKKQMDKLCDAAVGKSSTLPSVQELSASITQRLKEYQHFQTYCKELRNIISVLPPFESSEALFKSLTRNFDECSIRSLCVSDGQYCQVQCYPEAAPLESCMRSVWIMTVGCKCSIFMEYWSATSNSVVHSGFTFADVAAEVWRPVFSQCEELLASLIDCSISLTMVNDLFYQMSSSRGRELIDYNIRQLQRGVEWCQGRKNVDFTWIDGVISRMYQFWKLSGYTEAAQAFLKIRDALKLTGDFELVENVALKATDSMKDQTLHSIDKSVVSAAEFLEGFDEHKRACLRAYAESQGIIKWIQKETKDVNDLKNFVNISLATAAGGEDALTRDKLSNLRTVGSGFGALIYQLPSDAGYTALVDRCKTLWETLRSAPNLPDMMKGCDKEIEWYQSVKETQGSVEVTSYGQMNNIYRYGSYTIGSCMKGVHTNQSQVIRLELTETDKSLPKKNYSLDDLSDLESKLALITGRDSSEAGEVQVFLQSSACVRRIADALMALQQHGSGDYIGWEMRFPCRLPNVVDQLQQVACKLEDDLERWKCEIQEQRDQFYELNYYTTQQLLLLREDLGRLKESRQNAVNPEAMALLQSISRDVPSDVMKGYVQHVVHEEQEQRTEVAENTIDMHNLREEAEEIAFSTHQLSDQSAQPEPSLNGPTSVIVELLKSEASKISTPRAQRQMDDLSNEQKAVLANVINSFGFHQQLVLLAIERCANPMDFKTVAAWCTDNEDKYNYNYSEDGDEEEREMEEEEEELSEEEESMEQEVSSDREDGTEGDARSSMEVTAGFGELGSVIVRKRITIDEHHPVVKQLIKLGYPMEQCLQAAQRHPDDSHAANDYLMQNEEQSDMFGASDSDVMDWSGPPDVQGRVCDVPIVTSVGELVIFRSETEVYLTLQMLGIVLHNVSRDYPRPVQSRRPFSDKVLKVGEPNLLVIPPDNVLKTTLALYMEGGDQSLSMPTYEEVLVCSKRTTDEEVVLLWKRALGDPEHFRVFCLVHAEQLSYQVCDRALWSLSQLSQGKKDYKIIIICSNEEEGKSHIISKLQFYQRPYSTLPSDASFADYLIKHFRRWPEARTGPRRAGVASVVDPDKSYVRVVTSPRAGMGKSLYIRRRKEALMSVTTHGPHEVIVPIHGPTVTPDTVVEALKPHVGMNHPIIFHLDIAPNVLWQVDSILFCLLVLQGVCDSQGNVWRCHPAHLYMIESTIPKGGERLAASRTITLYKLLPSVECVSPQYLRVTKHLQDNCVLMDEAMFRSPPYQRVYQYLRRHIGQVSLDRFSYQTGYVEGSKEDCLDIMLHECGVKDPSWMELNHFLRFLDIQLGSCENSIFCDENIVGDVMSGLKTFVVKFMIRMSKDFATSSLRGEVATENEEQVELGTLEEYTIAERKEWEKSYHPYMFFNHDGISITFVGFNANSSGDLIDPVKNACIEGLEGVLNRQLHAGLKQNRVNLSENYQLWNKMTMMQKMGLVMGLEYLSDPDPSYVLTVDNVIKILAIQMRFRCNIPVVVMGETGCGKTRLIRFMCDMIALSAGEGIDCVRNMLIMKVHGGTTEKDVIKKVEEAEELAKDNSTRKIHTVLFFDEANTTEAIGLIKEVMCDRRVQGRDISPDVNFIAACNPYRKHTDDMIKKLESAGLGFYVKATKTQQKLGKIPLRQLVYRVLELPPSMRPLVYDFGQLTSNTEQNYTGQIVHNHCSQTHSQLEIMAISRVLAWCQNYMRERKDECSFVSLRDVERAMIVFEFFTEKMNLFTELIASKAEAEETQNGPKTPLQDAPTWSLVLSLSICYHARLQDRVEFETGVVQQFIPPLALPGGVEQFRDEIRWCQEVLLENMLLGQNIARNTALRENVFMMTIAIELRIPLFLVGKPGSSKSLAKSIVADSMHGKSSKKDLLKYFKEVHMISYQCSQLSTPESVIEVFKTAQSFQKKQDTTKFVSIVVLDEVGLAEDSPNLPLKALHPLLEDGTEGADDSKQIVDREKRVAFIGISNWALDPAKMNRGVMVTRGDPDRAELVLSARGICSNVEDDKVKKRLDRFFTPLAEAYIEICDKQKRQFFGLRDFYSLVKMLYWMCECSQSEPTGDQLEHAIKRNFGGQEEVQAYEIFKSKFPQLMARSRQLEDVSEELRVVLHPDCSPLGLIRTSLKTKEITWHGENRYLLFLTENYAALQVLKRYLQEVVGLPAVGGHANVGGAGGLEGPGPMNMQDDKDRLRQEKKELRKMEPFILFGSSFPKDKEYTQVCRNINQIKICMETGRTVILLNLENLYESLYDLLNQYYIMLSGFRYVDLGLQTHRVKCRVHENFKLILIAEKDTVYEKFPIPLINRLEKHFVLTRTVLLSWQETVLDKIIEWVKQFSRTGRFNEQDSFVGYQNDTSASVVFQATEQLREEQGGEVNKEMEESEEWQDLVMERSKSLLIQMATPDALIRLQCTQLAEEERRKITAAYTEQHHGSISDFICHHLQRQFGGVDEEGGLLLHLTTHSHLLSSTEMEELREDLGFSSEEVKWFLLQEFDTEMDFSNKIKLVFNRYSKTDSLLIIQCDSGHLCGDLIACARYRVDDERERSREQWNPDHGRTHVLFIIHLPRGGGDIRLGSFVGFQGGRWLSAHIDDLRAPSEAALSLDDALHTPISELFYSERTVPDSEVIMTQDHEEMKNDEEYVEKDEEHIEEEEEDVEEEEEDAEKKKEREKRQVTMSKASYQCSRLYSCIQDAIARAVSSGNSKAWAIRRVETLLNLIPQQPKFPLVSMESSTSPLDDSLFYATLVRHIHSMLLEREEVMEEKEWVLDEAMSGKKLQSGGTFRNVLSRKLDEVITPIFAEVLVHVDRYSNLDLLKRKNAPLHVQQLWLNVFTCSELCSFSYTEMSVQGGGDRLAGMGQRKSSDEEFPCQFPFFWLIKETVDSHWNAAITMTGGHRQQIHQQLCELLAGTRTSEMLDRVEKVQNEENCNDLYRRYLRDYIRCVHQVTHNESLLEYKLIEEALNTMINSPDLSLPMSKCPLLFSRIAAVHVAYHQCQRELLWFGRLTAQLPGVLVMLSDVTHNPEKMELHLHAVRVALDDNLTPPLEASEKEHLPQWLVWMQLCQNAIDSILTFRQETEGLAAAVFAKWQRVRAVQMFVEHVISKHDIGLEIYGMRLDFRLEDKCDFTTDATVAVVQKTLQYMEKDLEKKRKDKETLKSIRKSCHAFFMELVSTLCFGQRDLPEPELVKRLMNIVFTTDKATKDFTYSEKTATDKHPVIRSFLLQLLLEHDTEHVREHLEEYFERSCRHDVGVNQLSLLCIQCFEDAVFKQHSQLTLQQRVSSSLKLMRSGREGMTQPHHTPTSLPYLEAVAMLRYSLSVVAELLTQLTVGRQQQYTHDALLLMEEAKQCCFIPQLNEYEAGPAVYLVKLLIRQYGQSFLSRVCDHTELLWVVPEHLRQTDEDSQRMDRFVIYDPCYSQLRTALMDAAYGQKIDELAESCQGLTPDESVPLLLAVYEVVTQSYSYHQPSKHIPDEVIVNISSFIKNLTMLNRELKWTAEALLRNTQGGRMDALCCRPGHTLHTVLLSGVVVHTAVTILTKSRLDILQPLFKMVYNPGDLKQAYLPTVPQDALPEARRVLGGSFYECPLGHPYFISECGRATVESTCPQCGSRIGGSSHCLRSDNRVARQTDTTQRGYALGSIQQRENLPTPERSLSPAACAILRAIMHSALLWASCNNENAVEGLLDLTHGTVRPAELPQFFWQHLEHDISILGKAVGKSEDDACLLLHLILRNMATKIPTQSSNMHVYASLLSTNAREQWEKHFDHEYIQNVLSTLAKQMGDAMQSIFDDKKEDRDRLFYTAYEKSSLTSSSSILPHLWTYRSRITLDHLYQTLQALKFKDKCPILHEFLKEEPILRATQYLPELVQLQKQMFEFSHRRLDRKEAAKLAVREYIVNLNSEHKRNQFHEQFKCVKRAWELVKGKLTEYARVRVPQEYLAVVMSEELKLEWLIPTLQGPGVVTVAMLDLLVGSHNDFIEKSQGILKKGQKETNLTWNKQQVPVAHVQLCHLLDYEHQLLSIVLSHCRYSLTYGHGQDINYDLPALQKHIVDRFIHGKPHLVLDIPQVIYRRDVYTATSFANIRKKVSRQIKLSLREQQDIVADLPSVQKIRDCLDVVEIVMGFLASGGQKADTRLDHYLMTALKMKDRFSSRKALEHCCLGHVLSLWETLSVELARSLTLSDQEPFDTLHSNYLAELTDKEVVDELNQSLPKLDLHVLLCTLYEFIETNLRHRDPGQHEWGLTDVLKAHLDYYSLPQLADLEYLPDNITIGQTVSMWKHIVIYQHKKTNTAAMQLY